MAKNEGSQPPVRRTQAGPVKGESESHRTTVRRTKKAMEMTARDVEASRRHIT